MNYSFYHPTLQTPFLRSELSRRAESRSFRVDIDESDGAYRIAADLPGIRKDDVNIEVDRNLLTVAVKYDRPHSDTARSVRRERLDGEYTRRFTLPDDIDSDNINADMADGVLTLTIPKSAALIAKRITIK